MFTHIGPLHNYNSSSFTLLGQEKKQHGLLTVYLLDSCDFWRFHIFSLPWGISDFIYFFCVALLLLKPSVLWLLEFHLSPHFFLFFSVALCIPSFGRICISLGVLESLFPMEKYNHIRQSWKYRDSQWIDNFIACSEELGLIVNFLTRGQVPNSTLLLWVLLPSVNLCKITAKFLLLIWKHHEFTWAFFSDSQGSSWGIIIKNIQTIYLPGASLIPVHISAPFLCPTTIYGGCYYKPQFLMK